MLIGMMPLDFKTLFKDITDPWSIQNKTQHEQEIFQI